MEIDGDEKIDEIKILEMSSQLQDNDLEDGEIETDEDDDEPIITAIIPADKNHDTIPTKKKSSSAIVIGGFDSDIEVVTPSIEKKTNKFKRSEIADDDWAGNIEHAIAAALKRDGIEPPIPKLEKRLIDDHDRIIDKPDSSDDLRKNRKRKKREEKDKNKKRSKHLDQQEHSKHEPDDIDEDEMLCVRGGSPSPMIGAHMMSVSHHLHRRSVSPPINASSGFYDSDDSYSSYGSYESVENRKMSYDERRQSRRGKDRRQRKFTEGGGSGQSGGRGSSQGITGGSGKRRNRNDNDGSCIPNMRGHCNDGDDCNRSHDSRSQRKLELCKFYLMDCCAKKDKCSYMHGDFPCKYYYLGMECVYKTECKFSHGKPLTEQLRNILLKHIETAPKEILGNFRRISRENATNLLLTTHAKLCSEHGIENTMESPSPQPFLRQSRSPTEHRSGNPFGTPSNNSLSQMDQVSPRKDEKDKSSNNAKNDKPRKSRWCDFSLSSVPPTATSIGGQQQQPVPSPTPPISSNLLNTSQSDILSLKNLKGVITPEQIDKLSAIGIENLEQISQLTVAQLNNVGLTIGQINEIQLNAMNIQKLGLISNNSTSTGGMGAQCANNSILNLTSSLSSSIPVPTTATIQTSKLFNDDSQLVIKSTASQDVDMRFLVGAVQASTTQQGSTTNSQLPPLLSLTTNQLSSSTSINMQSIGIASPEPTPNSGNLYPSAINSQDSMSQTSAVNASKVLDSNNSVVDVSQYLKDSNLDADDKDDDDALNEDEPELLIDESRSPSDDEADLPNQSMTTEKDINATTSNQEQPMVAIYDPKLLLPQTTKFNVINSTDEENWDDDCEKNNTPSVRDDERNDPMRTESDDYRSGGKRDGYPSGNCHNDSGRDGYYGTGGRSDYYGSGNRDNYYGSGGSDEARGRYTSMYGENNKDDQREDTNSEQYRDPRLGYFNKQSTTATTQSGTGHNYDDDWGETVRLTPVNNYDGDWGETTPSTAAKKYNRDWSVTAPSTAVNNYAGDWGEANTSTPVNNYDRDWSATIPSTPVNNYDGDWDTDEEKQNNDDDVEIVEVIPPVIVEPSPPTKYHRASIYDGTPKSNDEDDDDDDNDDRFGGCDTSSMDRDARQSPLDSSDIDLRLPFKPVMTNYTPATEIDGSISSHAPITYKVIDVSIPKPDYSEIRRTMTVTEKTLDPRLRRIFCMKDARNEQYGSDCELLRSPPQSSSILVPSTKSEPLVSNIFSAPRVDPRRRKETQDASGTSMLNRAVSMTSSSTNMMGIGQNVDIRLLLQKSHWYKNLNSKFKIMVNQQLALVSTELKKFHQDPSPDKVFDMKFLATNQYLQQVLTNLGIFIDGNGQILQLDSENDDQMTGGIGMLMGSGMMMDMPSMGLPNMDFMRPPVVNPRFMGGIMNSFGPRFGDIRPGLLGVAPGVNPFNNPFDSSSATTTDQFGSSCSFNDDYGGIGGNSNDQQNSFGSGNNSGNSGNNNNPFDQGSSTGGKFYGQRHGNDGSESNGRQSGNRGNRNFRQSGNSRNNNNNSNSNDRWGNSGGGGGNQGQGRNGPGRNRNYDGRGGGRDRDGGRRDKQK